MNGKLSILYVLAIMALVGCAHQVYSDSNADLVRVAYKLCNDFGKEEAKGFESNYKNIITSDFLGLMREGNDVPSATPFELGDEEEMWYWFKGQDYYAPSEGVRSVTILSKAGDSFVANVNYRNCIEDESHCIIFKKENDAWLIDDIDNRKARVRQYVDTSYVLFSNGGAQKILSNPALDGLMNAKEREKYLRSVDNYLKKWGSHHKQR